MTESRAAATLFGATGLLERAISYTLGNLHNVTSAAFAYPTPCREWDLSALLAHMNDSLVALQEAIDLGRVGLSPVSDEAGRPADPVAALRERAGRLLAACADAGGDLVSVGGCPVPTSIVTCAGAVEVAVHGWDVAQACGHGRPIPPRLAGELLRLSPLLVTSGDRPGRFAAPVTVPPRASQGDRLIAFLGRRPGQLPVS
jgi:uncharacterized protein (TIGR03086 family)